MKALAYDKPQSFSVKQIETPKIKDNQVLMKVKSCGICKTDVHIHNGSHFTVSTDTGT